jgi:glycosyltransferase involved in cell wall biosynthesis
VIAAFFSYGSLDSVSGGYLYDRMLLRELAALGVEIDVVTLPERGYGRALADNLAPLPARRWDIVIQDELGHPALVARNRRLRAAGIPIVALVHNLRSRQPRERARALKAAVERRYLRGVDGVLAVCASTLADLRALAGDERVPAAIAHPGRDHIAPEIDDAVIEARAAEAGPLRVLFVAAVARHKGLDRLLAALARLPPGAAVLEVAGSLDSDAAHVRAIRREIARLGLADRVRLRGQLTGDALAEAFRGSQLFALPSDREAYPLAALEALGFGLPALLTDRGGTAELLGADGQAGLLLAPDDVDGWAAALARLGADRAELGARGRAARARWLAHGAWRDTARAALALLERVSAARRPVVAAARPPG